MKDTLEQLTADLAKQEEIYNNSKWYQIWTRMNSLAEQNELIHLISAYKTGGKSCKIK